MIDIHVHFGQFNNNFFNPDQVIDDLINIGIKNIGLMPTITEIGDNIFESHEQMIRIVNKYKNQIIPILWIHYSTSEKEIKKMLDELPYKIIKIHGYIHEWHNHPKELKKVIEISMKNKIPVMFHTGGCKESNSFKYKKICKNYPSVNFILAHSRPIKGTINIMKECKNVYCDISFTRIVDIQLLCKNGLSERVLWGTDYPIYSAFDPTVNMKNWYKSRCDSVLKSIGEFNYKLITENNFLKIIR